MAHFGERKKENPRYSDQPHPWWTLHQQNRHMSAPSIVRDAKPEQPVLKVTQTNPDVQTVKRWTTDLIEHNQLRNQPRLFDQLRPMRIYAKDFAPLENYSSFEWTRNQSLRQQAEARKRNSEHVPRSKLDPVQF